MPAPAPYTLRHETVAANLLRQAQTQPQGEAAVYLTHQRRYSWAELGRQTDLVAAGFAALGVRPGDHIAIWGTNVPQWLLTQLAAARLGAVLVTINPEWKSAEVRYAIHQSDTRLLVMMPGFEKASAGKIHHYDYLAILRDLLPEVEARDPRAPLHSEDFPALRQLVLTSGSAPGLLSWEQMLDEGLSMEATTLETYFAQVRPEDPAMIQYTSGTTGFPKGAVLTHTNIVNNALAVATHMRLTAADRVCAPVPYYHCFGSILFNLACVVSGATMIVPADTFEPDATLKAAAEERATALYGVPTMFIAELASPSFKSYDLSSLRTGIIAGAPVDSELMTAVNEQMGATEMTIAYGLTEASPVTHQTLPEDSFARRTETVGRAIPHTEARIVDPGTLETLPPGEVGEIWVKGFHVMQGYYQKPKETADAIVDGWLRTGDLGTLDEDGYYRIVGRLKEMLIVGGHNVYPAEVEQALHHLLEDKVEMLQVVGLPHPRLQEVTALAVKCRPGETLTLEEVQARCADKLEWPKIPRYLEVMDDFSPVMTVTGKIQKFRLRDHLCEVFDLNPKAPTA
ncbi:MAG: AMP-binding protein [Bacteroidetes bacterium]|nr:MAG: AMP-binding protein [Bacteroidota bacterium]